MYFSSLYRRGVRSSQTKKCCLPSIFLSSCLLVRNSFFLYDTNLAMIGRGFSLFLLFCPSRCTLCISLSSRSISSSSTILNKTFSHHRCLFYFLLLQKIRTFSLLMYCSCLSSWKTSRFVFWTISSRSCSFFSSSWFNLFAYSTIFFCIPFSLFSRFFVILVTLSSFSFWMSNVSFNCWIPCQSWYNCFFFFWTWFSPCSLIHHAWFLYPISIDQYSAASCILFDTALL